MNDRINNVLDVASGNRALVISIEPADLLKLFLAVFLAMLLANIVARRL